MWPLPPREDPTAVPSLLSLCSHLLSAHHECHACSHSGCSRQHPSQGHQGKMAWPGPPVSPARTLGQPHRSWSLVPRPRPCSASALPPSDQKALSPSSLLSSIAEVLRWTQYMTSSTIAAHTGHFLPCTLKATSGQNPRLSTNCFHNIVLSLSSPPPPSMAPGQDASSDRGLSQWGS